MRRFCASFLTALCLAPGPAAALGPPAVVAPAQDLLDQALDAWQRGEWARVRAILGPLLQDEGQLGDADRTATGLRHLADATLLDPSLDPAQRQALAAPAIERLLDLDPAYEAPADIHGAPFYAALDQARARRKEAQAQHCAIERTACQAELHQVMVDQAALTKEVAEARRKLDGQPVQVVQTRALNRAVALVPLGVGHFYNGRNGLGAGFLGTEVAVGAAALGLLLTRTIRYDCVREQGFRPGSLVCTAPDLSREQVKDTRNAEQAFGLILIGTVALDVLIAQIMFQPVIVEKTRTTTRDELDEELERARPPGGAARPGRRRAPRPDATIRPHFGPGSIGLSGRF
jgi:hypothetical protein